MTVIYGGYPQNKRSGKEGDPGNTNTEIQVQ